MGDTETAVATLWWFDDKLRAFREKRKRRWVLMAVKTKKYEALSPQEATNSVGYGYSAIITQLLSSLDQPIRNTNQFRQFYKQMLEDDESIGTGLEYLAGRVVSKIGEF